jgi:thermitase
MSTEGPDAAAPAGDPFVSGVAPAVELIPIRATKGAAIFSTRNLIRAIDYAAAAPDIDIISISLGGPFKPQALRQAIIDATQKGIIVVCGAGNKFGFRLSVAYPAAFDEVIAVAASTYDEMPWPCSCRGPAVDISAPGWSVWCARTVKKKKKITYDVDRDSGTSFATAGIAGIAALWLSYHGRDTLVDKYGAAGVPAVFKQLLQESCQVPPAWPTDEFGPGIADARALLDLPLPEVAMMLTASGRKPISTGDDALETLVHLAYPAPRSGIAWTMARVMGVPETMLPAALHRVGGEISFKVATEMPLLRALQAAAQAAIEPEAARKAGRTREQWVASVRRRLASDPASQQLRQSLATHGDGGQPKRNASRGGRVLTGRESTRSQRAK